MRKSPEKLRPRTAFLAVIAAFFLLGLSGASWSEAELAVAGQAYLSPVTSLGVWRMRLPGGGIREFSEDPDHQGRMSSEDGWTGEMRDGWVRVSTRRGSKPKVDWCFQNGTLKVLAVDGKAYGIDYPEPVRYAGTGIPPLWPDDDVLRQYRAEQGSNWSNGPRLLLWFTSPNRAGAFLAMMALVMLAGLLRFKPWASRVPFAIGLLVALGLLAKAASRGALLAFAVGALIVLVFELRRLGISRRIWCLYGGALMLILLAVGSLFYVSGRTRRGDAESDRQRQIVMRHVPGMIRDAPFGWGSYRRTGLAYFNWYQMVDDSMMRNNLISDHITRVVGGGWVRGGVYLAFWIGGVLLLLQLAWRGASPLPAALWSVLAVTAAWNLIFGESSVFILPLLSLALLVRRDFWRRPLRLLVPLAVGVVLSVGVFAALGALADGLPRARPHIGKDGPRILIGGRDPHIWVVDDGAVLGGAAAGMDIRRHYRLNLRAPAVGYVRDIRNLPSAERISRLVLAGKAGADYLDGLASQGNAKKLPRAICFLSPQFPVSRIPAELRSRTSVSAVIGEFAWRYDSVAGDRPDWVKIVKGAELYIPDWMKYALAE